MMGGWGWCVCVSVSVENTEGNHKVSGLWIVHVKSLTERSTQGSI